jgi:hypothetical protein
LARKTKEELNALQKKLNVDRLWSWSRYHTYEVSNFEYFLKYILNKKEDRTDSIYGYTGGLAHDILEKFYLKKIKFEDMIKEFEDGWTMYEIADLKFNRNDEDKDKKIRVKYKNNLIHFFKNHNKIKGKVELEKFITIKIGTYVFQGYLDFCRKDKDGNYIIQDWKTSSIYKGKKAIEEAGQLILYAIGLNQMGVPFDKIRICWNFLKYCNVTVAQAKINKETGLNTTTVRQIERSEIGSSLHSSAKMWLTKLGYEERLLEYLDLLVQTNDIKCLPKDVQSKFQIDDCYVYVDITDELINSFKVDIINTLHEIKTKELEYHNTLDEKIFWDSEESIKKQDYYLATLCGYSPALHKPYGQYLDKLKELNDNKDNVFYGMGSDIKESKEPEEDLSWLELL